MCEMTINAFKAICRQCNDEMKTVDRKDLVALKDITDKHGKKAELLGFSKTKMMYQIGVINGVFKERG